jgi:hypothetical protein
MRESCVYVIQKYIPLRCINKLNITITMNILQRAGRSTGVLAWFPKDLKKNSILLFYERLT